MALHIGPNLQRESAYHRAHARRLARERRLQEESNRARQERTAADYMRSMPVADPVRDVVITTSPAGAEAFSEAMRQEAVNQGIRVEPSAPRRRYDHISVDTIRNSFREMFPNSQNEQDMGLFDVLSVASVDECIMETVHLLEMGDEPSSPYLDGDISQYITSLLAQVSQNMYPSSLIVGSPVNCIRLEYAKSIIARFARIAYQLGIDRGLQLGGMIEAEDNHSDDAYERAEDEFWSGLHTQYERNEMFRRSIDGVDYSFARTATPARDVPLESLQAATPFPPTQLYQDAAVPGDSYVRQP